MGLTLGAEITLISPKGAATALGTVPRVKAFTVGAVFEVGMYEYDNGFVYIPLADAQAYFQLPTTGSTPSRSWSHDPERIGRYRPELRGTHSPAPTPAWSTGSSSTRTSSPRCRSSAT